VTRLVRARHQYRAEAPGLERCGVRSREWLWVRRRFLQKDALREAIRRVVNATLTDRRPEIWGEVTAASASDAKYDGVWDQHLMTAYHARYSTDVRAA